MERVSLSDVSLEQNAQRRKPMKYALLWLIGVPIPVLIIGFLIFH
jgi:hypothetical protein